MGSKGQLKHGSRVLERNLEAIEEWESESLWPDDRATGA